MNTPQENAGAPDGQQSHHERDAAHALLAAIAQLDLALRESQEPVSGLGALFAHQAYILTELRAASHASGASLADARADPAATRTDRAAAGADRAATRTALAAAGADPAATRADLAAAGADPAATRTDPASTGADPAAATTRALLDQLQSGVFQGIQQLQFYDRLVQHLSILQEYLIGVANELDSANTRAQAQEVWNELHAKLRRRLISDEQRGLLDLFLAPNAPLRVSAQATRSDYSPPGSFEMF